MFSGIVKGRGRVLETNERSGDRRIVIGTAGVDLGGIVSGDSVAVNGVCLTAVDAATDAFTADVSTETLARTTLGRLESGDAVNLEASLRLGDAVSGHLVYGHVDTVGTVVELAAEARSVAMTIAISGGLSRYVAEKGSITVDGVSLTINAVSANRFTVNVIPHTRDVTIIAEYVKGTPVNIEVDMIARYLERLIAVDRQDRQDRQEGLSLDTLKRHGFIKGD